MAKVEFHHGIFDKQAYACRLLRKASRAGVPLVVTGDAATLQALDRQLWVFDEQEFLPHVLATGGASLPERLHATPIWLSDDPASVPGERAVLVNLGSAIPPGAERFERLFDLVASEPEDRQLGRARWKAYVAMGWDVQPHEAKDGPTP